MSETDYFHVLERNEDVYFQDNEHYVCGLRKAKLSVDLLRPAAPILRAAATSPAGALRSLPAANRTAEELQRAREGQLGALKDVKFPYPRISRWCLVP
jgi:hypothetical protein